MFRIWFKCFDDSNHLIKDFVVANDDPTLNRTKKIFAALEMACGEFDLSNPLWLDANIADFKNHSKVRFSQDNFIDTLDFAYLEMQVIEEDNT